MVKEKARERGGGKEGETWEAKEEGERVEK